MTNEKQPIRVALAILRGVCACLLLAACGAGDSRHEITETRQLPEARPEQRVAADASKRLGARPMDAAHSTHGEPPTMSRPSVAWDVPSGWREVAPKPPVTASFAVPGREGLDVSISIFPGAGGGMLANINRWRGQMGLESFMEADVAALPRVKVLGIDAPLLLMNGTFRGAAESTMAAVVVERPDAAVFVKMVGPTADVTAELDKFRALCDSLRDASQTTSPPPSEPDPSAIKWIAPNGWVQAPEKRPRLVTFLPKDVPGVECYVTVLPGAAGGLAANVNFWRQNYRLAPLSAEDIAALPTVPILGREAPMVEIDGGAQGMYGLVCELGERTVFVKMTGPMDALRAERARFLEFCKSLSHP